MTRPSQDALPFLVRHGDTIWPLLLVLGGVLSVVVAWRRRRRAGRWRIAQALARSPSPPTLWAHDAEVAVRGVLRGAAPARSVAAIGFSRGREQSQLGNRAWPGAWLEVGDGEARQRVELSGAIAVVAGSAVGRFGDLPAAHFDLATVARDRVDGAVLLARWRGRIHAFHVREVSDGDEVLAIGRLQRQAGDGEQGYRDGAARWTLEPIGQAIDVAAIRAVADPPWLTIPSMAIRAIGGVILMFALLAGLWRLGSSRITVEPGRGVDLSVWASLRAIAPGERKQLMVEIEGKLHHGGYSDAVSVATLAGLVGGCASAADALAEHGQLDDALAEARRCGDASRVVRLLVEQGEYAQAAEAARIARIEDGPAILASLATGAWTDAARPFARVLLPDPGAALGLIGDDEIGVMLSKHLCLAVTGLTRSEPKILAMLEELGLKTGGTSCGLFAADLMPAEDRVGFLALVGALKLPHEMRPLVVESQVLAGDATAVWSRVPGAAEIVAPQGQVDLPLRAGVAMGRIAPGAAPWQAVLVGAAVLAEIAGDRAEVDRLLALVEIDAGASGAVVSKNELARLRAAFALRRGDDAPDDLFGFVSIDQPPDEYDVVNRAVAGDARPLARWCQTHDGALPRDARIWRALRRAEHGRAEVATCLAYRRRPRPAMSVVELAWRAALERDLAAAAGDDAAAARWQAIAARHVAVLGDPAIDLALEIWALDPY